MSLRENINKIHYELTDSFENVKIEEKENKNVGKYFQISAFNEGKELKMKINFIDLEMSNFNWAYLENPLNENSDWIERNSDVNNIINHIDDIFNKNRFSEDYLNSIKK